MPPDAELFLQYTLIPLHTIEESTEIVRPLLRFKQVYLSRLDENREVFFHRHHFLVRFVPGFCLQLGVHLLDFACPYQIGAGVIIIKNFHRDNSAVTGFFWN